MIANEEQASSYVRSLTDAEGMERLQTFVSMVLNENSRQNLIAKATEPHIWQRHIADSAQLIEHVSRETFRDASRGPVLDLGSGPGFPGVVLAALFPQTPFVLVEARGRRAAFLAECVDKLHLKKCRIEAMRLERVDPFAARLITARAFASLPRLLELCAPFSTKETGYLLPKGRSAAQELASLKPSVRAMFHVKHSLTDPEAGIIVRK